MVSALLSILVMSKRDQASLSFPKTLLQEELWSQTDLAELKELGGNHVMATQGELELNFHVRFCS